ncbi:MAG: hypothetical protein FWE06_00155 [Oscillospiraceae bacterium]|nr:hypothetical protein [Oscillospiraceae bacterium]
MNNLPNVTNRLSAEKEITHGIRFGKFNSKEHKLFLHERVAPTPQEKEIKVSVPYQQGCVDMSHLLGHRVYENRTITYTFYRFGVAKNESGNMQSAITNLVMLNFDEPLHDSYESGFFYRGKCREVLVVDEYAHRRLRVEMTFELHPFKLRNDAEILRWSVLWDSPTNVHIFNNGVLPIPLTLLSTGYVNIGLNDNQLQEVPPNRPTLFKLRPGQNEIWMHANRFLFTGADITLTWREELL